MWQSSFINVIADDCTSARLVPGCCNYNCYVRGGRCNCDAACRGFGDCCTDVPENASDCSGRYIDQKMLVIVQVGTLIKNAIIVR